MCCAGVVFPNAPPVDTESRHVMAVVAVGDRAQPASFYTPLTAVAGPAESTAVATVADNCHTLTTGHRSVAVPAAASQPLPEEPSSSADGEIDSLLNDIQSLVRDKHAQFGSSLSGLRTLLKRLRRVHSVGQWESFLHTVGSAVPLARHHHAAIRVQPTAVVRRRPGVTRGSKRLPAGRPAKSDKRVPPKRRRSLQCNVSANQPNAKPHGSGH